MIDVDAGYAHSLEVADFDLDGHVDIFAGAMHFADSPEVRLLLGNGGSSWTSIVLASHGTHNALAADLDLDGRVDIVGKNFDGPKEVEIWWNRESSTDVPTGSGDRDLSGSPLDGFSYVHVDDSRERFSEATAFFGLAFGDVDGDRRDDIVSGRYVYSNPGGDLTSPWSRTDLTEEIDVIVDAMLITDVDGDRFADIIATALPDVWWIEAGDATGVWTARRVAEVPRRLDPTDRDTGLAISMLTDETRSCSLVETRSPKSGMSRSRLTSTPSGRAYGSRGWPLTKGSASATSMVTGLPMSPLVTCTMGARS